MTIIGKTRNGKVINDLIPLDKLDYIDFTIEDHYDAACIWMAHGNRSDCFRKREYHALKAGLSFSDMVQCYFEMKSKGAKLLTNEKGQTHAKR